MGNEGVFAPTSPFGSSPLDCFGPMPGIDPFSLRPKLDSLLIVHGPKKWERGIYLGKDAGRAILEVAGAEIAVEPSWCREIPIDCPAIDFWMFQEGYNNGAWGLWNEHEQGTRLQNRRPSAFSRGYVKGHDDAAKHNARCSSAATYNEVIRHLLRAYPEEYIERVVEFGGSGVTLRTVAHRPVLQPGGPRHLRQEEL